MAIHNVGPFSVEVLHQEAPVDHRLEMVVAVYKGEDFEDQKVFDFRLFNTKDLWTLLPCLRPFSAKALRGVIDDGRVYPKGGNGAGGTATPNKEAAGKPKKAKPKSPARRARP